MNNKSKTAVAVLLIVILLATGAGYYLFNKKPVSIQSSSAIDVTAVDLYKVFETDSAAAAKKYAGKVVLVKGVINSKSISQKKEHIILLKTAMDGAYVNCTMQEDGNTPDGNASVEIKGMCIGLGEADPDLGLKGDVYVDRCIINQ